MATGTGFGKTILIGDQFVLRGVPAIVSALPYETEATVELTDGEGWMLEDNRREVPGYKEKKKEQQAESIDHILEVMKIRHLRARAFDRGDQPRRLGGRVRLPRHSFRHRQHRVDIRWAAGLPGDGRREILRADRGRAAVSDRPRQQRCHCRHLDPQRLRPEPQSRRSRSLRAPRPSTITS